MTKPRITLTGERKSDIFFSSHGGVVSIGSGRTEKFFQTRLAERRLLSFPSFFIRRCVKPTIATARQLWFDLNNETHALCRRVRLFSFLSDNRSR